MKPFDLMEFTRRAAHYYSERLVLRPLALTDAWSLWQAAQNPAFNQHLLWERPQTPAQAFARVSTLLQASAANEVAPLSATLRETGEWVALFRFMPEHAGVAAPGLETGIWTHPRFWAGGFSQELCKLARDAAFAEMPVDWLIAKTARDNKLARHVIESVGLTVIREEDARHENGQAVPAWVLQVTREQWLALPKVAQRVQDLAALPEVVPAAA